MELTAEQIIKRLAESLNYGSGYLVDEALKILAEYGRGSAIEELVEAAVQKFEESQ